MLTLNSIESIFAIEAVRKASLLVCQVQAEMAAQTLTKDDRSPVTVADFASQALVAYLLSQRFPSDILVAEEDARELRDPTQAGTLEAVTRYVARYLPQTSPQAVCDWIDRGGGSTSNRFWTLDPIDGTKGFLRGDQYAVALALIVDGRVELGVLGCPNLREGYNPHLGGPGSLVVAVRGQGTWTTSLSEPGKMERLRVSETRDPVKMHIMRSFESGHTNAGLIDEFAQHLGVKAEAVLMDSQAKYAVLAAGKGDLIVRLLSPDKLDYREMIWDQAAGSLIVEEAGGRITDLDGKALNFTTGRALARNRGIAASNGYLHLAVLQALKRLGA